MRDTSSADVLVGRVFGILGAKNAEMTEEPPEYKFRSVFQGNNVHTKSGVSACDLYTEIANAPASFTAARCALAAAALTGKVASFRDALQAFLQARIDTADRVQTWVELPKEWWPSEWFVDEARTQPRYRRPVVKLCLALYGHPEAGPLWDAKLGAVLEYWGWSRIHEWSGVFVHADGSIIIAYVDDLLMCALPKEMLAHWAELEKYVEFKEVAQPLARYLGANYEFTEFDQSKPNAPRTLKVHMAEYSQNAVRRFGDELGAKVNKVTTPFVTDKEWSETSEQDGIFKKSCSSHVATTLFLGRVGRPDISTAVQRLCSAVSRWTTVEDLALIRLNAYLLHHSEFELVGTLGPDDLDSLEIILYTDADWNGDASTSKSTSGMWVELRSEKTGNCWPAAWATSKQTATSSSTCEAETVSLSSGLRKEALPIQLLLETFLGKRLQVRCLVDNTQAIAAVKRGYSKKLRHLPRTQRVTVGVLHECCEDPEMCVSVEHCPTKDMKADIFTKALNPAMYVNARDMINVLPKCAR